MGVVDLGHHPAQHLLHVVLVGYRGFLARVTVTSKVTSMRFPSSSPAMSSPFSSGLSFPGTIPSSLSVPASRVPATRRTGRRWPAGRAPAARSRRDPGRDAQPTTATSAAGYAGRWAWPSTRARRTHARPSGSSSTASTGIPEYGPWLNVTGTSGRGGPAGSASPGSKSGRSRRRSPTCSTSSTAAWPRSTASQQPIVQRAPRRERWLAASQHPTPLPCCWCETR